MLVLAPMLIKSWDVTITWEWFFSSFYIHTVYSIVLGLIVLNGPRWAAVAAKRLTARSHAAALLSGSHRLDV